MDGVVLAISLSFKRNELDFIGHLKVEDMLVVSWGRRDDLRVQ